VLELFVVTTCKWSINLFTNPNPIYRHTLIRDNIKMNLREIEFRDILAWDRDYRKIVVNAIMNICDVGKLLRS
jgi:hypothetical protein